jgi:hypothetical protein
MVLIETYRSGGGGYLWLGFNKQAYAISLLKRDSEYTRIGKAWLTYNDFWSTIKNGSYGRLIRIKRSDIAER